MGTNYYHRTNICGCCQRYDETHICKSFGTLHGLFEWLDEDPYGYRPVVVTWQQWKARLLISGEVWDEYGDHIPTDKFIAQMEDKTRDYRQWEWVIENDPARARSGPEERRYWVDDDGFTFYGGDFS